MKIVNRNIKLVIVLFVELFFIIICGMIFSPESVDESLKIVGLISSICMIITLLCVFFVSHKIGFSFFFCIFSYVFSFGQSMLLLINYNLSTTSSFSMRNGYFSPFDIFGSAIFVLCALCATFIGYCISYKNMQNQTRGRVAFYNEQRVRRVGWFLIIVSILPTFYLLYSDITSTYTLGYGSTLQGYIGIEKICSLISGFFISGMLMVFLFEKNRLKRLAILGIIGSYFLLQLIGGSRGTVFQIGVLLIIIWNLFFKSIDRKRAFWIVIFLLLGMFVFSVVSAARIWMSNGVNVAEIIKMVAKDLVKNNFLFACIREMGNTQIINTLVYKDCPSIVNYQLGYSYVKILWAILPNFIGSAYTGYIGVDITFSKLYPLTSAGLGASYISEGFWNFSYGSIIIFLIFGCLLGLLEKKFVELCNSEGNKDAIVVFVIVYLMFYLLFRVRGEFLGFGREIVYYVLVPAFLCKLTICKNRSFHMNLKDRTIC